MQRLFLTISEFLDPLKPPFRIVFVVAPSSRSGFGRWPPISDGVMRLSVSQLAALVDGMDWSRLHARDIAQPTATS
jgi:hypothetical protein